MVPYLIIQQTKTHNASQNTSDDKDDDDDAATQSSSSCITPYKDDDSTSTVQVSASDPPQNDDNHMSSPTAAVGKYNWFDIETNIHSAETLHHGYNTFTLVCCIEINDEMILYACWERISVLHVETK